MWKVGVDQEYRRGQSSRSLDQSRRGPVEPPDRVPVQADLPMLIEKGLRMVRKRLELSPGFSVYLSIQRQLEYLQTTVTLVQSPDPEKIDNLTLGVYAAREFETSDPDFADVLFDIHYLAARMA
jgi:hypothetical protein